METKKLIREDNHLEWAIYRKQDAQREQLRGATTTELKWIKAHQEAGT